MILYPDFSWFGFGGGGSPGWRSIATARGPLPQRVRTLLKMVEVLQSQMPMLRWSGKLPRVSPDTARQIEPFLTAAEMLAMQVVAMIHSMKADLKRAELKNATQVKKANWRTKPRWREDQN